MCIRDSRRTTIIIDGGECLVGEEKISRELWERTMNDLLSNPAKLKNYPFQMDREKLNGLR